jgi:hypothetical protein
MRLKLQKLYLHSDLSVAFYFQLELHLRLVNKNTTATGNDKRAMPKQSLISLIIDFQLIVSIIYITCHSVQLEISDKNEQETIFSPRRFPRIFSHQQEASTLTARI